MSQSAPTGIVTGEAGLWLPLYLLNNRKRWYVYRFLAEPVTQPTHDILPVTLREGEEQAQPGEQPVDSEAWT